MTVTMYGIPNCDTIKKARKWLEEANVEYQFHDYRKQGITAELITEFFQQLGWENVLNKRGTTYRQLTQEQKDTLNSDNAAALLLEKPAMIKRPILRIDSQLHVGFKAEQYSSLFA